jgi:solute carrier family 25 phosphate transporter 23/24/25/41
VLGFGSTSIFAHLRGQSAARCDGSSEDRLCKLEKSVAALESRLTITTKQHANKENAFRTECSPREEDHEEDLDLYLPSSSSNSHKEMLANVYAGMVAGVVSRTATAPFDRLRTLMQAGLGFPLRPPSVEGSSKEGLYAKFHPKLRRFVPVREQGVFRAMAYVYEEGGWIGFFRGNGTNCLKIAPEYALKFTLNPIVVQYFSPDGDKSRATLVQQFTAGCISGAATTATIYPLEVIKVRMTVAEAGEYKSLRDCIARTAQNGRPGEVWIARFYRGFGASLMGSVPFSGTQLGLNSYFRERYKKVDQPHATGSGLNYTTSVCISLVSSFAGITLAYPLNLVRTKLMTQGVNNRTVLYHGVLDCLRKTVHYEGVKGLYRGFVPNCMKALPGKSQQCITQL